MARPRRPDAAPLARARRGRLLRDVLLRVRHALLPGRPPSGRGDRTPTPREQELCAFWRDWELRLAAAAADRPRRRPGGAPPARPDERHRVRRPPLRAATAPSRSRSPSLGRERLAERSRRTAKRPRRQPSRSIRAELGYFGHQAAGPLNEVDEGTTPRYRTDLRYGSSASSAPTRSSMLVSVLLAVGSQAAALAPRRS